MWPSAVVNHMNAGKPIRHEWAVHARVRAYDTNALVNKGLWTGDYDLSMTLDNLARVYEGAQGGLVVAPIRYKIGTTIMSQEIDLALSDDGINLVRGYNLKNAAMDLFCLVYDPANMELLGARRFFKGFIDASRITDPKQNEQASMSIKAVSFARKGTMTTVGKKSHQSQIARDATDNFYKYSDLGRVASDAWGAKND